MLLGLGIAGVKHSGLPVAESFQKTISLETTYLKTLSGFDSVLLVPLGGLIVVVIRITLGIRMLGPFRPILIAIGLNGAGIVVGLAFFVLVLVVMLLVRPRLRGHGLPYFARLSILVATVVLLEIALVIAGNAFDIDELGRAVYFPIIVLCLAAEGFARVLTEEGKVTAVWRGCTTLGAAVVIEMVHEIPGLFELQLQYPEGIFILIAAMIVVGKGMDFRLLEGLNPRSRPVGTPGRGLDPEKPARPADPPPGPSDPAGPR